MAQTAPEPADRPNGEPRRTSAVPRPEHQGANGPDARLGGTGARGLPRGGFWTRPDVTASRSAPGYNKFQWLDVEEISDTCTYKASDVSPCNRAIGNLDTIADARRGQHYSHAKIIKKEGKRTDNPKTKIENHPNVAGYKTPTVYSLTPEGPKLFSVVRGRGTHRQMDLPLTIHIPEAERSIDAVALLDTGSTGSCMHRDFVRRHGLDMQALENPIEVYNADGTVNAGGRITHCVRATVRIGDHQERMAFLVTDLG
ncbi:hypothetical protein BD414DRAFT_411840, partial [Trametes punicea]